MKKILLFTIIIALLGCESPPVRRSQLIEKHPEWSAGTVTLIKKGFLVQGMTTDQVRAAWGRPCLTCTGTAMDKEWDKWRTWEYPTQIVFFDKDEKVTHWSKK